MPKFQALKGIRSMLIPWIERNPETGVLTRDQGITFNNGINTRTGHVPAFLYTEDPDLLKFLRSFPGNSANGGHSFEEIEEAKTTLAKEAIKPAPKKAEAPAPALAIEKEPLVLFELPDEEEAPEADTVEADAVEAVNAEVIPQPEVTTVQMASSVLRALDSKLTIRDTKTKAQVLALAVLKNISFPNL